MAINVAIEGTASPQSGQVGMIVNFNYKITYTEDVAPPHQFNITLNFGDGQKTEELGNFTGEKLFAKSHIYGRAGAFAPFILVETVGGSFRFEFPLINVSGFMPMPMPVIMEEEKPVPPAPAPSPFPVGTGVVVGAVLVLALGITIGMLLKK